ncbi:MAG: DUF389 domain-containing protein [Armatimonadetes bacterium]|nr:DUF389 domain-containing protein [Armatimonadota bacterium]
MRQLIVQVPRGHGDRVLQTARECEGMNLAQFEAEGSDGPQEVVLVHVPNRQIESLLERLQSIPDLRVSMFPQGALALRPPAEEAPDQVTNVQPRSPIEIFLDGLQSVGSWKALLGYAAAAGAVVWIGLYTETVFLLTAAMLIAPFAGPAMITAMATARGDAVLLRRGLQRYFGGLATTVLVSALLSLLMQQKTVTSQMVSSSEISSVSALLPLVAGAAGALHLCQSERSSLVSGAAVGILVAASLAPPTGIIGMASVLGRWEMVQNGLFVLMLQLIGINLSGSLVFRAYGLTPKGARYSRGKNPIFFGSLAATVLMMGGLLTWQFWGVPNFQRSSRAQRAVESVQKAVEESGLAKLVEANVRFTRPNIPGQETLLNVVYVQQNPGLSMSAEEVKDRLTRSIQQNILEAGFNVTPLVNVSVLEPPEQKRSPATGAE